MSRIKIFLLIAIVAVLCIVFIQNREPTTLRFFCGYGSSYCLYRSADLPLALWIALFTLLGIVVNLLGQALNRYSYSGSSRRNVPKDELYSNENWREDTTAVRASKYNNLEDSAVRDKFPNTSYEVKQEPQNVERSGSTYSYKYKKVDERTRSDRDDFPKTPIELDTNTASKEQDDEDWI